MAGPTRHLDLGCGTAPRNPYQADQVFGVDIREGLSAPGVEAILAANLNVAPVPFPDNHFDSLSAYDFLEHVPRVSIDHGSGRTHLPFIALMNEIWRVLKPDGRFYAVTPAFPHEKAWRDPTHVNILTAKSHRYFTRPELGGRMYGFQGDFELVRQTRCYFRRDYEPAWPGLGGLALRGLERCFGKAAHLVWEMRAIKDASATGR